MGSQGPEPQQRGSSAQGWWLDLSVGCQLLHLLLGFRFYVWSDLENKFGLFKLSYIKREPEKPSALCFLFPIFLFLNLPTFSVWVEGRVVDRPEEGVGPEV